VFITCVCGRVAENDDAECSLCGRDLTGWQNAERRTEPAGHGNAPTVHLPDAGTAPDFRSQQDYRSYANTQALPDPGLAPPHQGWVPNRADDLPERNPIATSGGRGVTSVVIVAMAVVLTGFVLGYFVIAGMLQH
jgi:hypothetical protein